MSAERDSKRFAGSDADRDPEVVDVGRHAIDFRGERNGRAGDTDEVAVVESRVNRPDASLVSMRQRLREFWRRPALRPFAVKPGQARGIALSSHKTNHAKQGDRERGDVISGKRAD